MLVNKPARTARSRLGPIQRDQRCLGAAVIALASERGVSGRKQLQGLLPPAFLVLAGEFPEPFPCGRFDNFDRDRAQCDCCFDRTDRAPVFEATARPLLRHGLSAFNQSVGWFVSINEVADGGDIDALFSANSDRRDIDGIDQLRCRTVVNFNDSEATTNAGIDA